MRPLHRIARSVCVVLGFSAVPVHADTLHVAVASNFHEALRALATAFEAQSQHRVVPIAASTGKLVAQIDNGAPFDAFFAADTESVRRLEESGAIVPGSRFTYARGALVLWSADSAVVGATPAALRGDFRHLAIANPALAPYGRAAVEVLQALDLASRLEPRLVRGENIAQTFQFVRSGNATMGFVARSQVCCLPAGETGSAWAVPDSLHAPIEQQAVLLRDSAAGRAFLSYCRSPEALRLLEHYGYDVP